MAQISFCRPLGRALAYSSNEKVVMAVKGRAWQQQTVKMAPAPVRALQTTPEHISVSNKFMSAGLGASQQWSDLSKPFSGLGVASSNSSSFLSNSRWSTPEALKESILRISGAVDRRIKFAELLAASAAEPAAVAGPALLPRAELVAPAAAPAAPKSNVQGLMTPAAAPAAPKSNVLKQAAGINKEAAAAAAEKAHADNLAQQRAQARAKAAAARPADSGVPQSAPHTRDQAAPKAAGQGAPGPKAAAGNTGGQPTGRAADKGKPVAKPACHG